MITNEFINAVLDGQVEGFDEAGNIYTFAPDRIGKGGYAGAVMVNFREAQKLLRFLFSSRKHYIKDLDVGYNTLGGMGIKELDGLAAA